METMFMGLTPTEIAVLKAKAEKTDTIDCLKEMAELYVQNLELQRKLRSSEAKRLALEARLAALP